ncbi:MAG: ABC transporter permease [Saprospiraceae bacterium]|nr:ABC transporter permease [Saprospiraceae bacterium]
MIRHILQLIWNKKRSNTLLFLEIFFSFIILFAVFTIVTRYMRMYQSPLGFQTENIWIVHMNFNDLTDTSAVNEMKVRLKDELLSYPQIQAASYGGEATPMGGSVWATSHDQNGFQLKTNIIFGDHDYLETLDLELVRGRWFNESDADARYMPIVITEKFYEETFKGKNLTDSIYIITEESNIVGVVKNFKYRGDFATEDNVAFHYKNENHIDLSRLILRIAPGTKSGFEEEVNQVVASITKKNDFTIEHIEATRSRLAKMIWIPIIAFLSICGFLVINVSMGLFGVLWHSISKRRNEIGLRRTLGASQGEITSQFVSEVTFVSLAGITLGFVFALQFPLLKVFPIEAINYYLAMALSAGIILLLVLLCSFYPSWQASKIHPATALHEE